MKYLKFTALLCIAMVLLVAVAACAAPATPAPTVAPTAAPKPTDVPKPTEAPKPTVAPTTAPTIAPTVAPTVAPTKAVTTTTPTTPTTSSAVPTGPAAALAAKKSGAEVFSDAFEKGTAGAFIDWNILDKDAHVATKSGITIVEPPVKAPEGKLAAKMFSNTAVDAQANKDFADLPQGRLTVMGMVPTTDPGFLGVELRNAGKRIFSIEMHPEGRFRWRDDGGNLQESKVNYTFDKWYPITLEWDATANIWNAWTVDDSGKTVLLTPPEGAKFAKETPGASPNRVQLRLNKATPGKVGYVDNLKVLKVE